MKKLAVSTFGTKSHSSADNEYRSEGKVVDFSPDWSESELNRAASDFIAMGMLALGAQEAAMLPIQQTVFANAERLGR